LNPIARTLLTVVLTADTAGNTIMKKPKMKGETTMTKTIMTRESILGGIQTLANSQGSYGRLLAALKDPNREEQADAFFAACEEQGFTDIVDFILWLEG
jgi:hypothetical protein